MPAKLTIEEAHKIAKAKKGKCLSTKYLGNKVDLRWECSKGHKWNASLGNVKKSTWCPICAKISMAEKLKNSIEDAIQLAKKNNGKCLSKDYSNNKTKLQWECSKGHSWFARYDTIRNGSWCGECYGKKRSKTGYASYNIEIIKNLAKERAGECLSNKYVNGKSKLEWKCSEEHIFQMSFNSFLRGSWCSCCKDSYGERLVRIILEHIYKSKFYKVRPDWLRSPLTNNKLELDGYNEKLKIAFEHQGEQHYREIDYFGGSLKDRILVDNYKKKICKKKKILLIEVPEIGSLLAPDDAFSYVVKILTKKKIIPSKIRKFTEKEFNKVYVSNEKKKFENIKKQVLKFSISVESKLWPGIGRKLKLKCNVCGFKFTRNSNSDFSERLSCPFCVNLKNLEKAKKIASLKGGGLSKKDWSKNNR